MILDFQESALATGVPRHLHIEPVSGKASVCSGVRRSGKSTYMLQLMQRLIECGVSRNEEERIGMESMTIEVIPAWKFLLYLSGFRLVQKASNAFLGL